MYDLVPFVQFKKREKHPWRSGGGLACKFTKSNTPPWVFFTFFKLLKWYQIAQSVSYFGKFLCKYGIVFWQAAKKKTE